MRGTWGWCGFAAWAVAGGLLAFAVLSWVGIFVLPATLVACWLAARSAQRPLVPRAARRLAGVGLLCLGAAYGARDYSPCPPGGSLRVPPGETSASCGGFDPLPRLAAVLALVLVGALAYGVVRRLQADPAGR